MAFVLTLNLFALTASTPDIEAETINDKFELMTQKISRQI